MKDRKEVLQRKKFLMQLVGHIIPTEASGAVGVVNDKVLVGNGHVSIGEGAVLDLKRYTGKDNVRYYGAIGGDTAINLGLSGKLDASIKTSIDIDNDGVEDAEEI